MKKLELLKTVGIAIVLTLSLSNLSAQNGKERGDRKPKDPVKMAEMRTEKLVEDLSLSEATAAKVLEINKEFAQEGLKLREEGEKEHEEIKTKMKDLNKAHEAKLEGILTKEEFKKYKELQKENRGKIAEKAHGKKHKKGSKEGK